MDVQWPGDVVRVVTAVEELGYHRYWLTEHHSSLQSGSPQVMCAVAASRTHTIRIGIAGALIKFHSPVELAEAYRALALCFPGRIDAGVASGGPSGKIREALLDGRPEPVGVEYANRVTELARLLRRAPDDPPDGRVVVGPVTDAISEFWICGMSTHSAELAGRLGASFVYHEHMRRNRDCVDVVEGPALIDRYRSAFEPSRWQEHPNWTVVCFGMCADEQGVAEAHWSDYCRAHSKELEPSFIGTPSRCREQLESIAHAYEARELTIQSLTADVEARIHSYRLLAHEMRSREQA